MIYVLLSFVIPIYTWVRETDIQTDRQTDIFRYQFTHTHPHTHTHIYIYIYIYGESEKDRVRKTVREERRRMREILSEERQ